MSLTTRLLPRMDRSLEPALRALASDTDRWLPLVRFAYPRPCINIDAGPDLEAWLLTWMPGQATGFHDHGGAGGAFAVVRGRLSETWVDAAGRTRTRRYGRGRVRSFGSDHIHDVFNDGTVGAVSLHVYRPALETMTRYAMHEGALAAVRTDYAGVDW